MDSSRNVGCLVTVSESGSVPAARSDLLVADSPSNTPV